MAGFRFTKAKGDQAALKIGIYGAPGSGKTFTSLLLAEGLGKYTGKRVAMIDTEHGTDFYCQTVKSRAVHPEAFDFDALYTRSITDTLDAVQSIDEQAYGVIIVDSISHIWQASMDAYSGKTTSIGTIPMQAWGKIKKPYLALLATLLSSSCHVIICGRQAVEYGTNEETEELKAIGVKMKSEASTPYEMHILIRMESVKPKKTNEVGYVVAYAEKDRTGVLAGHSYVNPTFESICGPLLGLLGKTQAQIPTTDETAAQDAEALGNQARDREQTAQAQYNDFSARITLVKDVAELKKIGAELTPRVKAGMGPDKVDSIRTKYQERERELTGRLV